MKLEKFLEKLDASVDKLIVRARKQPIEELNEKDAETIKKIVEKISVLTYYVVRKDQNYLDPKNKRLIDCKDGIECKHLKKLLPLATTLEELANYTEYELLQMKGIGPQRVRAVKILLQDNGLDFKADTKRVVPYRR